MVFYPFEMILDKRPCCFFSADHESLIAQGIRAEPQAILGKV